MKIATNIPYRDMLSAVTICCGNRLPAVMPMAHPLAQNKVDNSAAAYIYDGGV